MKSIHIVDTTLKTLPKTFSFKDKLELGRLLQRLCVDTIELPAIQNEKADTLLVRTLSSFVKNAALSVAVDLTPESLDLALKALDRTEHGIIRLEVPVSAVGMEYIAKKKGQAFLDAVTKTVSAAACHFPVEFCAKDATRAEESFLITALKTAEAAGASFLFVSDETGETLPDAFAALTEKVKKEVKKPLGVCVYDGCGLALADSLTALLSAADAVKTAVGGDVADLSKLVLTLQKSGNAYGLASGLCYTEVRSLTAAMADILEGEKKETVKPKKEFQDGENMHLTEKDDRETLAFAVKKLGYELSDEDEAHVYEEFLRAAAKKEIGARELDAIVANAAQQVPATYKLESYVVNSGNIITSSAQITLKKDGELLHGISMGDGPIDAAFMALEGIIGHHYELDDFEIQAVTEGKEAMGSALVRLRDNGKLYSGNGLSTDIIGASIRAYLSACNKIIYEENT